MKYYSIEFVSNFGNNTLFCCIDEGNTNYRFIVFPFWFKKKLTLTFIKDSFLFHPYRTLKHLPLHYNFLYGYSKTVEYVFDVITNNDGVILYINKAECFPEEIK